MRQVRLLNSALDDYEATGAIVHSLPRRAGWKEKVCEVKRLKFATRLLVCSDFLC